MAFEKDVKKAFDEAKAKLDKKYQDDAKSVDEKIRVTKEKAYKRLAKET